MRLDRTRRRRRPRRRANCSWSPQRAVVGASTLDGIVLRAAWTVEEHWQACRQGHAPATTPPCGLQGLARRPVICGVVTDRCLDAVGVHPDRLTGGGAAAAAACQSVPSLALATSEDSLLKSILPGAFFQATSLPSVCCIPGRLHPDGDVQNESAGELDACRRRWRALQLALNGCEAVVSWSARCCCCIPGGPAADVCPMTGGTTGSSKDTRRAGDASSVERHHAAPRQPGGGRSSGAWLPNWSQDLHGCTSRLL